MTQIRLACGGSAVELAALDGYPEPVSLLVAFPFLGRFQAVRRNINIREYVLDSGAFTAFNTGKPVDRKAFTEAAKGLLATDPKLKEVFALDVIGDWRASARNTEAMWAEGVPAIPCYHYGEPWDVLVGLAKDYPKVALGGVAGGFRSHNTPQRKLAWVGQCFTRVWPKKIHGFGMGGPRILQAFPFHSADASNWSIGPQAYGTWASMGKWKQRIPLKITARTGSLLRSEIDWYRRLESRLAARWSRELAMMDRVTSGPGVLGRVGHG